MLFFAIVMRRLTACMLLATYGSVGVLGYGLHALWHVHHHHGLHGSATGDSSCSSCHHHCCSSKPRQPEADDTANALAKPERHQLQLRQHSHTNSKEISAPKEDSTCSETVTIVVAEGPCPICAVLSQSPTPELVICSGSLVATVPAERPVNEILQPLYLPSKHLARGPPAC